MHECRDRRPRRSDFINQTNGVNNIEIVMVHSFRHGARAVPPPSKREANLEAPSLRELAPKATEGVCFYHMREAKRRSMIGKNDHRTNGYTIPLRFRCYAQHGLVNFRIALDAGPYKVASQTTKNGGLSVCFTSCGRRFASRFYSPTEYAHNIGFAVLICRDRRYKQQKTGCIG